MNNQNAATKIQMAWRVFLINRQLSYDRWEDYSCAYDWSYYEHEEEPYIRCKCCGGNSSGSDYETYRFCSRFCMVDYAKNY